MQDPLMTLEGAKNMMGHTAPERKVTVFMDAMNQMGANLAQVFTPEDLPDYDRAAFLAQEEEGAMFYAQALPDPRKVLYDAQQSWDYARRSLVRATSFLRGVLYAGRADGHSDDELALLTGMNPEDVRDFLDSTSFVQS